MQKEIFANKSGSDDLKQDLLQEAKQQVKKDAAKESSASDLVKQVENAAGKNKKSAIVKNAEKIEKKLEKKVDKEDVKTNMVAEIQK